MKMYNLNYYVVKNLQFAQFLYLKLEFNTRFHVVL